MSDPSSLPGRCLSDQQIDSLREAPPGHAPEELARHLAACPACQERALFGSGTRRRRSGRGQPEWPTPTRALLLVAVLVAAMAAFFVTLRMIAAR
jgi:hypothetical protein